MKIIFQEITKILMIKNTMEQNWNKKAIKANDIVNYFMHKGATISKTDFDWLIKCLTEFEEDLEKED